MIIKDLSGVHSMGMYNSRCTKFPKAVLAKYRMVKLKVLKMIMLTGQVLPRKPAT